MNANVPLDPHNTDYVVKYFAGETTTRIVITEKVWEKADELLQQQVTHILEQDPIKQVNTGYGLKHEPTLGGYVFHTPHAGMYLLARSNEALPEELTFNRLVKPDH